jgi:NAD(P)-dependent dehydrogenase (short-subunit alcohol dehydrogenase family)
LLYYNSYGAFHFSQAVLPQLIESAQELNNNNGRSSSFLCFSGATGALKGSAKFAAFSPAKFALRGIAQSLAREFGEKGVHVSHVIIDGMYCSPPFFRVKREFVKF